MNFDLNRFNDAVARALKIETQAVVPSLSLGKISTWDSLNHFVLIFEVEQEFSIRFESEEIPTLKTIQLLLEATERHSRKTS